MIRIITTEAGADFQVDDLELLSSLTVSWQKRQFV